MTSLVSSPGSYLSRKSAVKTRGCEWKMFLLTCGAELRLECYSLVKFVQYILHEIVLNEIVNLQPRIRFQYLIHVENTFGRDKRKRCSSSNRSAAHFGRIEKGRMKIGGGPVPLGPGRIRPQAEISGTEALFLNQSQPRPFRFRMLKRNKYKIDFACPLAYS